MILFENRRDYNWKKRTNRVVFCTRRRMFLIGIFFFFFSLNLLSYEIKREENVSNLIVILKPIAEEIHANHFFLIFFSIVCLLHTFLSDSFCFLFVKKCKNSEGPTKIVILPRSCFSATELYLRVIFGELFSLLFLAFNGMVDL